VYVLIVYDVGEKRVQKVCKLLRHYLNWIQNSVFEGEITPAKLKEIQIKLKKIMNKENDSFIIYEFRTDKAFKRKIMGKEKSPIDVFL